MPRHYSQPRRARGRMSRVGPDEQYNGGRPPRVAPGYKAVGRSRWAIAGCIALIGMAIVLGLLASVTVLAYVWRYWP